MHRVLAEKRGARLNRERLRIRDSLTGDYLHFSGRSFVVTSGNSWLGTSAQCQNLLDKVHPLSHSKEFMDKLKTCALVYAEAPEIIHACKVRFDLDYHDLFRRPGQTTSVLGADENVLRGDDDPTSV